MHNRQVLTFISQKIADIYEESNVKCHLIMQKKELRKMCLRR